MEGIGSSLLFVPPSGIFKRKKTSMFCAFGCLVLRGKTRLSLLALLAPISLCAIGLRPAYGGGDDAAAVEQRLAATDRYLVFRRIGRTGIGNQGIDLAADYLADQLRQLNRYGVKTDLWDGGPFQKFQVAVDAELGPNNRLLWSDRPRKLAANREGSS